MFAGKGYAIGIASICRFLIWKRKQTRYKDFHRTTNDHKNGDHYTSIIFPYLEEKTTRYKDFHRTTNDHTNGDHYTPIIFNYLSSISQYGGCANFAGREPVIVELWHCVEIYLKTSFNFHNDTIINEK